MSWFYLCCCELLGVTDAAQQTSGENVEHDAHQEKMKLSLLLLNSTPLCLQMVLQVTQQNFLWLQHTALWMCALNVRFQSFSYSLKKAYLCIHTF